MTPEVPSYLADYADVYKRDPRAAARAWFADAGFGLFMHYGLYSLLGRHEWVMYREAIPVAHVAAEHRSDVAVVFRIMVVDMLGHAAGKDDMMELLKPAIIDQGRRHHERTRHWRVGPLLDDLE